MTLPPLPHLGSTGVVNVPGVREQLAQSLGSLPEILLAVEQQKQEKKNAEANQAYLAAQVAQWTAKLQQDQLQAQEAARMQGLVGKGLSSLAGLTFGGQETGQGAPDAPAMPAVPGIQQLPTSAAAPPTVDEILAGVDPSALPTVLDKGRDLIKAKRDEEQQAKQQKAAAIILARLPEKTRQGLEAIGALPEAVYPAGVKTMLYQSLLQSSDLSPDQIRLVLDFAGKFGTTLGESEAYVTGQGGPSKDIRPRVPDPLMIASEKLGLQRAGAVPGDAEQKQWDNGQALYHAALDLEKPGMKAPPRLWVSSLLNGFLGKHISDFLTAAQPKEYQEWWSAMMSFLDPKLRSRSGAAFGKDEVDMIMNQFITLGDDPASLAAAKARRRREAVRSSMAAARRAINDGLESGWLDKAEVDGIRAWLNTKWDPNAPPTGRNRWSK